MTPPTNNIPTPSSSAPAMPRGALGTNTSGGRTSGRASRFSQRFRQRFRRRRLSAWTISLNLTSMIDVVFLLLFFFLVVTRFRAMEGMLPAQLPTGATVVSTDVPRTPIRIRLLADPKAPMICHASIDRFHEAPLALDLLADALKRIRGDAPGFDSDTPVYLLAGEEIIWDHVVNAYNAAMTAQYEKILFAGSP